MDPITSTVEPVSAPPVLTDGMSLADYRAQRDGTPAAAPPAEPKEPKEEKAPAVGASEALGENESDEGDDSTSSEQPDGTPADPKRPAKKGGWQRKLEKAEREIEDLKQKLAGTPAATPAATTPKEAPVAPAPATPAAAQAANFEKPEPQLEDFDSMGAYTKALLSWDRERVAFETAETDKQNLAKAEREKVIAAWNGRVEATKKEHADYDAVMQQAKGIDLTPAHHALFLESEQGAQIAYDLASNPDELKKFAAMNPLQAAKYFGRLELNYSEQAPKTETRVSSAPRPVRPVGVRSVGTPDVSKMTTAEYRAAREAGRI